MCHSSLDVTHRILCNLSRMLCKLVKMDRYNCTGNGPFNRGSCWVWESSPCNSINCSCKCNSIDMKCWMERDILILFRLRSVEVSVGAGGAGVWAEASPSPSSKKLSTSSPIELKATNRVYSHPTFKQNLSDVESASI